MSQNTAPKGIATHWARSYWMLLLLWPVLILPLAYLTATILETTFNSMALRGQDGYLPLLTQWYRVLGSGGFYGATAAPLILFTVLAPFRNHPVSVSLLGFALVAALYLTFGGMLAAYLAYVKLCI